MAEPKGWTSVRVRRETMARLELLRARLTLAAHQGKTGVPTSDQSKPGGGEVGVTLDAAINRALDVYESKLARSSRGARRRPAGDPVAGDPEPTGQDMLDLAELSDAVAEEQAARVADVAFFQGYAAAVDAAERAKGGAL